jgi:DNA modification methylase
MKTGVILRVIFRVFAETGVIDPFMGTGTTLLAAKENSMHAIGIEIEERYCEIAARRCSQGVLGLEVGA